MSAPNDIMKSTYSFPSASHTCEPLPRSTTIGPSVNTARPRDGEFTPSTSDRWARSNHSCDRVRLRVVVEGVNQSSLVCGSTAIHHQGRARHERRIVAGEEQRSLGDFLSRPHSSHGAVRTTGNVVFPL